MWVATFAMPLLTFSNLWASTYVTHVIWQADLPLLSPALPYLFIAMFLGSWALAVSAAGGYWRGVEFLLTSFVVYAAAMPLMAWAFIRGMVSSPTFKPTPKGREVVKVHLGTIVLTMTCGAGLLLLSLKWGSPFSPVAASFGISQLLFPLVLRLHRSDSTLGRLATILVVMTGCVFVTGLISMWLLAS